MLSLLGSHIDYKGYVFKPFYLILGVLYFMVLLALLGTLSNIIKKLGLNKLPCQFVDTHTIKTQSHMVLDSTIGALTQCSIKHPNAFC